MHDVDVAQGVDRGPQVGLTGAVRRKDESGVVANPPLLHRLDRDAMAPELVGDLRQYPGTVRHLHQQVELRLDLVDGTDPAPAQGADRRAPTSRGEVLG